MDEPRTGCNDPTGQAGVGRVGIPKTQYRATFDSDFTFLCELVWIWCELEYYRIAPTQSYRVALTI
jgi:hypothetical protein